VAAFTDDKQRQSIQAALAIRTFLVRGTVVHLHWRFVRVKSVCGGCDGDPV
jgi:hypothetical protein